MQENKEPRLPLKGLADSFSNRDSHVIIARCNVEENDVPVRVYHTPTIRFYPAHGKLVPLEYFGEKENVDQYIEFIERAGPKDSKLRPISRRSSPSASELQGKKEERLETMEVEN